MLSSIVLLIVAFSVGALTGYVYRDHLSKVRQRRVLAQRYSDE